VVAQVRAIFGLSPNKDDAAPTSTRSPRGQQVAGEAEAAKAGPQEGQRGWECEVARDFSPADAGSSLPSEQALTVGSAPPEADESKPSPDLTEEQWEAREPVRQLLENLLSRQVEIFDAQHHDMLRQCLAGPSPRERAAEIVPTHPNSELMQGMEDSNFRQIARMTGLLIRLKRQERWMEAHGFSEDVIENKGR